ncbi:MAG TPA: hypothetical protein PK079_25120 [Leptospiraceae bacterium]|nr:hypothetical protein [Leptospiraceae bacterium]HMW08586.1 hypothetical protein [Leptospiraceae bacterium]HMZ66545.1 hypothetical protein [Leptospiraceae bacterium]HNA10235.1 hypothetical protein [Leptospiraceae bacterium]HNB98549.1 hypothetical protein [Leptospiraceae bacterium]
MLRIIEINPSEIPIQRTYTIGNVDYTFAFTYNARFDFISVSISLDGEIVFSTKLTYGINMLFGNHTIPFAVVPMAEVDLYKEGFESLKVNKETLGSKVFLYFEDGQ